MQKKLSLISKKLNQWIKTKKVNDIIIFGSFAEGKSSPNDIDLCILIKDEQEKNTLDIVNSLGELTDKMDFKFHINVLTASSFVKGNTFAKTILSGGYSVRNRKKFSFVFGFESKTMFVYSLKNFSRSERVRFHYMLKGRYGSKGMLKEVGGEFAGAGCIIVPSEKEKVFEQILNKWNVKYKSSKLLVG